MNAATPTSRTAAAPLLAPGVRPREVVAWAMYDFANSGYTTVVITAVFNAYFVAVVAGDAPWATLAWTATLAVSYAAVMITGPVIGAYADQRAAKKRLLVATTLGCVAFTAALALVGAGRPRARVRAGRAVQLLLQHGREPDRGLPAGARPRQGARQGVGVGLGARLRRRPRLARGEPRLRDRRAGARRDLGRVRAGDDADHRGDLSRRQPADAPLAEGARGSAGCAGARGSCARRSRGSGTRPGTPRPSPTSPGSSRASSATRRGSRRSSRSRRSTPSRRWGSRPRTRSRSSSR